MTFLVKPWHPLPESSWRTLLFTPAAKMPPRKLKAPPKVIPKPALSNPSRQPQSPSFTLPLLPPWLDHDPHVAFQNILLPLQDPKEEALGAAKKKCKLGSSTKRIGGL